jgi:hypothetical protein
LKDRAKVQLENNPKERSRTKRAASFLNQAQYFYAGGGAGGGAAARCNGVVAYLNPKYAPIA